MTQIQTIAAGFAATLDRKELAAALAIAAKVTEARNMIPILSCVLLKLETAGLVVEATDLDLAVTIPLEASERSAGGAVAVQLKALRDTVKKMTGAAVRLQDIGGDRISLTDCATGATARLATRSAADWPQLSDMVQPPAAFDLDAAELARDLERVRPAISTEETRYYLNGVFFSRHGPEGSQTLRLVATDGHKLAVCERPLPAGAAAMHGAIVPRKAIGVVQALLGKKPAGRVAIEIGQAQMAFAVGTIRLRGKLVDGTFPDYTRVIPSGYDRRLTGRADELAQLVTGATAHCSDKARAVHLSLTPDSVIASATDPESGTAAVQAEAMVYDGDDREPMAIGFNGSYLTAICGLFGGIEIQLEFGKAEACPVIIRDPADFTFLAVLMPMRTGSTVMTPADVARLNWTVWEAFREDIAGLLESARDLSKRSLPRTRGKRAAKRDPQCRAVRARMNKESALVWQAIGDKVREAVAFLESGGMSRDRARQAVRLAMADPNGDTYARIIEIAAHKPSGSFRHLRTELVVQALRTDPPAAIEPEPQPIEIEPEPEAPAVDVASPAEPEQAEEAPSQPPQDAPAEAEAITIPAAAFAALLDRVARLEAAIQAPPAPEPSQTPAVVVLPAEDRAQLVAEIQRLRDLVEAQATQIESLKAKRGRTAVRLRTARTQAAADRKLSDKAFGRVADLTFKPIGKGFAAAILPPVPQPPAAPAVVLPAVLRRARAIA